MRRRDVGIADGKIASVESRLNPADAARVVDARGQVVTPGLIDLHTHVYWGATYYGVEPDPVAARTGVTTWLDVGSAGAYGFPGFRRFIIEPSRATVYALLNLSAIGLIARSWEFVNLRYCDAEVAERIVDAAPRSSSSASRPASTSRRPRASASGRSRWRATSPTAWGYR